MISIAFILSLIPVFPFVSGQTPELMKQQCIPANLCDSSRHRTRVHSIADSERTI